MWAMHTGIASNPEWYPDLTSSSSFEDFQAHLHNIDYGQCPVPCRSAPAAVTTTTVASVSCGRPCQIATEQTDCGGTCGLCEQGRCAPGSPGFCARRCSAATWDRDCGGTCGLCDGVRCTTSPFCGRPCQIATEQTDCGGTCGLCEQGQCVLGTPGLCGRRCSVVTEDRDCGGTCGLCDGVRCTTSPQAFRR